MPCGQPSVAVNGHIACEGGGGTVCTEPDAFMTCPSSAAMCHDRTEEPTRSPTTLESAIEGKGSAIVGKQQGGRPRRPAVQSCGGDRPSVGLTKR